MKTIQQAHPTSTAHHRNWACDSFSFLNFANIANSFTPFISVFQQGTSRKMLGQLVNIEAPTRTEDPRRSIERVSDK